MSALLWGLAADTPLSLIREQLQIAGTPFLFLDQRDVLATQVTLRVSGTVEGSIAVHGQTIDLGEITAVYPRTYDSCRLGVVADHGPDSDAWRHASEVDELLYAWLAVTDALVVNPVAAMTGNDSKPAQLMQLYNLGWSVPETLVTTDAAAAQAFWQKHGEVIYKSVSSVRSQVSRLRPEHAARFADLSSCPTQFQRFIPGQDFRVHVVGSEVFACEVLSAADDYRYDGTAQVRDYPIADELAQRCVATSAALGLSLSGIDLRRTPAGEWYCFEVNTSPGFSYYEQQTGQPIARAVARLLSTSRPADANQHGEAVRQLPAPLAVGGLR